jgi:hypothetical protein
MMQSSHTMGLRSRWLNFIMHLTAAIAERKQDAAKYHALKTFFNVITIILLEGVLAIVSIPLYFSVKAEGLSPENEFSVQYVVRRTITFSLFLFFLVVFAAKTAVIVKIVAERASQQSIAADTTVFPESIVAELSAPIDSSYTPPVVLKVSDSADFQEFVVEGTAQPFHTVIVHVERQNDPFPVNQLYTAEADASGSWKLISKHLISKPPGDYLVRAQSYDPQAHLKSALGQGLTYHFVPSWTERALDTLDLVSNVLIGLFIGIGFFVVFLTF